MYKKVPTTLNFVEREKETLKFWKDNQIFEKSVQLRQGAPAYTFFDGPPTANGKPHIGHVLTRAMKDIIPRYKTMRGYDVLRKAGWDTHGLPVELEVEKELGLDGKEQIEQYGVIPFIQKCKESVWKYKGEWEVMSDRMGFWADMDNPYITYDNDYIESEWWALKAIYEKGLLYKGKSIQPYSPAAGVAHAHQGRTLETARQHLVRHLVIEQRAHECLGHDIGSRGAGVRIRGFDLDIIDIRSDAQRSVGRQGPRGRGPDDEVDRAIETFETCGFARELKANEDRRRRLVGVLDLGLSKSRMAVLAPMNGLMSTIDHAAIEHSLEDLDVGSIMLMIERQVGVIPIAKHAQAAEAGLLQLDVLDSELITELADLRHRRLIELGGAELFLDLVLNGLTMAVPTGDIRGLIALHSLIAVDDVLGDLVLRVAEVDRAVGVRGAVVKDELLVALVLLEELGVDVVVLPLLEPLGLVLGEARAHREARLREVRRLLVLVRHLRDPFLGTKKAPVPCCWDEALTSHFA